MTIQIESVANPRYSNAAGSMILCDVKFSHLDEVVEFSASPDDSEAHGRAIYAACVAGTHGPVAAYVMPVDMPARMWVKIQIKRHTVKQSGVKVTVLGVDKWFHSDDSSRIQQLGLLMMGAGMPAGIQWKTMDGTFIEMTPAIASAIFSAAAALDMAAFAAAEGHKAAMTASVNPEVYDYSAGWPAVYQ